MSALVFETQLAHAREWEKKVARWAARRGWYVLPAYDYAGKGESKAPKLVSPDGNDLVLPDLVCFRNAGLRWLEVKWKRRAALYRATGELVTGISLRLFKHYCQIEERVAGEVFVVFLHEDEREVRGDSLNNLRAYVSHVYKGPKMGRGGMVFWPYLQIPRWGELRMIEGPS